MKIYTFPTFRIETQLFHVPGAGYDGGLTSGGAQFITPEPGGFSVLEIAPALVDNEWLSPDVSWLLSKISGQVFRCRLAKSPQIAWSKERLDKIDWDNRGQSRNDGVSRFTTSRLKGTTTVTVDVSEFGRLLRPGHVIGHAFDTYLVDEVTYSGNVATCTVTPPLRRNIATNDTCEFTPWFTGRISNGEQIRAAYNSMGHIKPGNIILQEAIV